MDLNEAQQKLNEAQTKMDLYEIAGSLNNRPEHVQSDKVTFMGFLDLSEAKQYVQDLINQSKAV